MWNELNINTDMYTWAIDRAGMIWMNFAVVFPRLKEWKEKKKNPSLTS